MSAIPIVLEECPIADDALELVEDFDSMIEVVMCSCSAGDDQPY